MSDQQIAKTYRLRELISALEAEHERRIKAAQLGISPGPATGFKKFDKEIGGALFPGLHILQAAPGIGKTALALQIAAECGFPALYVTAEMATLELFRRLIARHTRTPLVTLTEHRTLEQVRDLATSTASSLPQLAIIDGASYFASKAVIEAAAEDLIREFDSPPLIVIDSLQAWSKSGVFQSGFQSEYEIMGRGIRTLIELSTGLNSAVLCIAQRNRASQEKGGLFAAKGSGEIEYCAETVLELSRITDRPNSAGELDITAGILKNRHGSVGAEMRLRFNGAMQIFREV